MKLIKMLFIMSLTIALAACSSKSDNHDATLDEVSLDTLSTGLVDVIGSNTSLLEMKVQNKKAEEISLSVDHYIKGEYEDTPIEFSSSLEDSDSKNPGYLLLTNRFIDEQQQWVGAIILGEGSTATAESQLMDTPGLSSSGFQQDAPSELVLDEKTMLAAVVVTDAETLSMDITSEKDLEKYEEAYVYYAELK